MKMATKILQGDPTLLKVFTDPLTEYKNRNFQYVPPLSSPFFNLFGQGGISSTNWREQPEFCREFLQETSVIKYDSSFNGDHGDLIYIYIAPIFSFK